MNDIASTSALGPNWQRPDVETLAADLTDGQIHVWRLPLHQAPSDLTVLAPDEQQRADRFRYDKDRRCFVTARWGLRQILAQYLGQTAGELTFSYGKYGKPYLAGVTLEFNLAHSGDLALVAVCRDRPVGIDLELIKPMSDLEKLTERFFTAGEHQRIVKLAAAERSQAFFRTWTCKESYLKATGDGLRKLKGLEVAVKPQQAAQFVNPQDWDLQEIQPGDGYVGAIAAAGFDWRVQFFEADVV